MSAGTETGNAVLTAPTLLVFQKYTQTIREIKRFYKPFTLPTEIPRCKSILRNGNPEKDIYTRQSSRLDEVWAKFKHLSEQTFYPD